MKPRTYTPFMALMLVLSFGLSGCLEDDCDMTFKHAVYEPVYMTVEELHNATKATAPRPVVAPGKIYLKDAILLINELGEGVHVFDNKNPENPQPLVFINAPGNYDLSMNCDNLYLDSGTDMLVFDMSDPSSPFLINRVENALPALAEFNGYVANSQGDVVIKWKQVIKEETYDCKTGVPQLWSQNQVDENFFVPPGNSNSRTINPASPGKSGSMSRFAVLDDHMYVVSPREIKIFNVVNCESPNAVNAIRYNQGGGDAEMITTLNDLLLVGASSGMSIYQATDPTNPTFLSNFSHVQACDPVVAQGEVAYVTLRNGSDQPCGTSWSNQLDVINIANPSRPRLLSSFPMHNPHGLGIDGNVLFVADGNSGLKVFDATHPHQVGDKPLATFSGMHGYDVIADGGNLLIVGEDGIAQYDYRNVKDIQLRSTIPVTRE